MKHIKTPDTLVIIMFIGIFASILTYLIPVGAFEIQEISYTEDGIHKTRNVIEPDSFHYDTDKDDNIKYAKVGFFAGGGAIGLMNFPFEGLTSGSKWGSAIGVIMFMLVIGGSFGIVMQTKAVDNGIVKLIEKTKGNEYFFIPILFFIFSLGGAIFGMGEEAVAFAIMLAPLMVRLGYDSIVTIMVTYVATQIGFATSWMNPFSVAIAQSIAGIPVLSGSIVRMSMWMFFTLLGILVISLYAYKIKKNIQNSITFKSDEYFRKQEISLANAHLGLGEILILLSILLNIIWVIYGVIVYEWYIPEIASQFFTMGIIVTIIACIFNINGFSLNKASFAFKEGASMMLAPALLVGFAKGVLLILGGSNTSEFSVLNSILNSASQLISGVPEYLSAWFMFVFQSIFNFFVTSGSAQAALTMPLLAPLSDISGISKQVTVLAFQLGDGFTNIIVPTSASLMATLGACRVDWGIWIKFCYKFLLLIMFIASIIIVLAQFLGFS